MDEFLKRLRSFRERLDPMLTALALDEKNKRLKELNTEMLRSDFWSNQERAQKVTQEASELESIISFWKDADQRLTDLEEVSADDKDDQTVNLLDDLSSELEELESAVELKEIETLFTGPHDRSPAIVTIYAGAGGVDAQDWSALLERMYIRFAESHGLTVTVLGRTPGQEAGIKNVTLRIAGPFAHGYLAAESGVHRLVRLSPFNADQARHTSFAMVEVLPELDELEDIEIPKEDVRVDVFRASGHGGQSVNTTDSAVRLTHIPTGISVSCQNERSQAQNKQQAWKMLLGKLSKFYAAKKEEERQQLRGELTDAAWGNQIRSYVLHPYKMVKDLRTRYESSDPDAVLNGDLMPFIEAELRRRIQSGE